MKVARGKVKNYGGNTRFIVNDNKLFNRLSVFDISGDL